jgi:hypothetical protein
VLVTACGARVFESSRPALVPGYFHGNGKELAVPQGTELGLDFLTLGIATCELDQKEFASHFGKCAFQVRHVAFRESLFVILLFWAC